MASTPQASCWVDELLWTAVHLDAPAWFLHPIFKEVFRERASFNELCSSLPPLCFAPGLVEALAGPSPPSLGFLKSLSSPDAKDLRQDKIWGVYIQILEMAGRKPRLYIGSGTCTSRGMAGRLAAYENGLDPNHLPRHVWRAFQQGFTKTHTALLCWSQAPPAGLVTIGRQRFLGIEGIFQMFLFAAYSSKADPIWAGLVPWSREDVQWQPLCSHVSLNERSSGDFDASPELLEQLAAERKARVQAAHLQKHLATKSHYAADEELAAVESDCPSD